MALEDIIQDQIEQYLADYKVDLSQLPMPQLQDSLELNWDVDQNVVAQPIVQEATLLNGWLGQASCVPPSYINTNERIVHVWGVADGGAATSVTAFYLPEGMRPKAVVAVPLAYLNGGGYLLGDLVVLATGEVRLRDNAAGLTNGSSFQFSFTFHAEQ